MLVPFVFAPLSQASNINIFTLTHVSDVLARTLRADIEAGIKFSFWILIDNFRGWSEVKEDEEDERLPEVLWLITSTKDRNEKSFHIKRRKSAPSR